MSSHVLKMLNEIAVKEVELAAEALARVMKVASEAQNKLDLLIEYRQGYFNNLNKSLETGVNAETYQNFHQFIKKLDQAISGQQDVVISATRQVGVHRELWQESQRKKLSYEVLIDRSNKRELKVEQKKDQKATDEFASRISRTKHK